MRDPLNTLNTGGGGKNRAGRPVGWHAPGRHGRIAPDRRAFSARAGAFPA